MKTLTSISFLIWTTNPNPNPNPNPNYFLVVQMVKNLPVMRETQVQSLGEEDPLEKGIATHSSMLAWEFHRVWQATVHGVVKGQTWLSDWLLIQHLLNHWYFLYNSGSSISKPVLSALQRNKDSAHWHTDRGFGKLVIYTESVLVSQFPLMRFTLQ